MKKIYLSDIIDSLKTLDFWTSVKVFMVLLAAIGTILLTSFLIIRFGSDGPTDYNKKTKKNWKFNPYDPFSTHRHAKYDLSEYYNDELDSKEKDKLKVEQNSNTEELPNVEGFKEKETLVCTDDLKEKVVIIHDSKETETVVCIDNVKKKLVEDAKKTETLVCIDNVKEKLVVINDFKKKE